MINSGKSCAEITLVQYFNCTIGVARPTLDVDSSDIWSANKYWGLHGAAGAMCIGIRGVGATVVDWEGHQGFGTGDVLRLLLDSDAGTLTVKKNGTLCGVAVTSGLTGDLCWAMSTYGAGDQVRIKAVDPREF